MALGLTGSSAVRRVLLLLCVLFAASSARAADSATTGPNADTPPLHPAPPAAAPKECPERPSPTVGAPSSMLVELDPDTLWRPRGSEVRFTIRGPGGPVVVKMTRVCFGWSSPDGAFQPMHALVGSPEVRSVSNPSGATEYGAVVPGLRNIPNGEWWPRRSLYQGAFVFTGAGTVPVADMVVEVTPADGSPVVTAIQVGITFGPVAWVVVAAVVLLLWGIMAAIARERRIAGRNLLLRIISTSDGYASLSQLQIVLWTLVVGLSAIYVMTLSGNLISISEGTLTLLGIASGSALLARVPVRPTQTTTATTVPATIPTTPATPTAPATLTAPAPATTATTPATPTAPAPGPVMGAPVAQLTPEWSDLIIPNRQVREIDVTRLQMLAFTLITAAFVVIKVVVDYEIPAIPANFLILMGISNGVYVAGRRLPSTPRDPTATGG